jgi:UDP-glucose 4-epimerase
MTPRTWLITGGAGFIGSHVTEVFVNNDIDVVVYDSLVLGRKSRIEYLSAAYNKTIPVIVADIRNLEKFEEVVRAFKPDGVIHTAALKSVRESTKEPEKYWEVNFHATKKILEICLRNDIHKFIFSSTAAVYGSPLHQNPIKESDLKNPISPYGESKLAAEGEVERFLLHSGNSGTSLRFFNVVGSSCPELKDQSTENLVPIVKGRLDEGLPPVIYGKSYPTPDGTCVRDFIDVRDVANAHFLAAISEKKLPLAMNVGTGVGLSVLEVIIELCKNQGRRSDFFIVDEPRSGDAAYVTSDVELIKRELNFNISFEPINSLVKF